jgi:hypothetical protein
MSKFVVAHYDVSTACNLRCESCYYFDAPQRAEDCRTPEEWERFLSSERDRGVNFAMIAGAEPSLRIDRLRLVHRYIPNGVVYTNGTIRVPEELGFRIHISVWGIGDTDAEMRGHSVLTKAMVNYRNDPRAVCIFVISALTIDDIVPAARLAQENGLPVTYSYFSPSMNYLGKLSAGEQNDNQTFRISSANHNPMLSRADFARARTQIELAIQLYPDTVLYSLPYDEWVTKPELHDIDPETGIARDCGVRLTKQINWRVDFTCNDMKCGSPQGECSTCRGYGPSYATYFTLRRAAKHLPGGEAAWYETRNVWTRIFMPLGTSPDTQPTDIALAEGLRIAPANATLDRSVP